MSVVPPPADITARLAPAVTQACGPAARVVGVEPLAAEASARRYVRVHIEPAPEAGPAGLASRMAMVLDPAELLAGEEATNGEAPRDIPFLAVGRYLAGLGLPVPHVHAVHAAHGVLLLDDLGDTTFARSLAPLLEAAPPAAPDELVREPMLARYREAVDLLVCMQAGVWRTPEPSGLVASRRFDESLLYWEVWHFVRWMLECEHGVELSAADLAVVREGVGRLVGELTAAPQRPIHRDWQSRNLMVTPRGLYILDFQDMLTGPFLYDLVALLRDSYSRLSLAEVRLLLAHYRAGLDQAGLLDAELAATDFEALFHRQTLQRKLKDAGRFVFIRERKGNPDFMRHVPASLAYARLSFSRLPSYAGLWEVFARHEPRLSVS